MRIRPWPGMEGSTRSGPLYAGQFIRADDAHRQLWYWRDEWLGWRPSARAKASQQRCCPGRRASNCTQDELTIMPTAHSVEAGGTYPPRRHHRAPAAVRVGLLVVGWLIVAVLGLAVLLRLVAWDSLEPLIVLDALTPVVYLPAWVVAVGALIVRRWWLAAAAVVIVVAHLAFVAPELLATAPVPAWARHAPVLRVFDANVDKSHRFEAGYVQAIAQDRPDLI